MAESNTSDVVLVAKKEHVSYLEVLWFQDWQRSPNTGTMQTCQTPVATVIGSTSNLPITTTKICLKGSWKLAIVKHKLLTHRKRKNIAVQQTSVFQSFASGTPYEKKSLSGTKKWQKTFYIFLAKDIIPINTVSQQCFVKFDGQNGPEMSNRTSRLLFKKDPSKMMPTSLVR